MTESTQAVQVRPFPAEWLKVFTEAELTRLAIRTVDDEMTDQEALKAEGLARRIWEHRAKEMHR